jgi:DNA-binding beta-propeller fold protein YncE
MGSHVRRWLGPFVAGAFRYGSFLLFGLLCSASCKLFTRAASYPTRLVDSVTVSDAPLIDAQVSPNGKLVYVTDEFSGKLSVVRTSDMQLVAQIPFNDGWWGGAGQAVVCSPDGKYAYATEYRYDWVAVVRASDQVVVDSLMVDGEVTGVAVAPDGKRLYMAVDADSDFVVVVRLPDDVVEDTIFMPGIDIYITSLQVAPDGARLFAGNLEEGGVYAIGLSDNTVEWTATAWGSAAQGGIAVHPAGSPLYVVEDSIVSVRESGTGALIHSISLPRSLWSADVSPDGSCLYVTCGYDSSRGAVAMVRTSDDSMVRVTAMPSDVWACDAAPSPDGNRLYVAGNNGKLYVLGR